MKKQLLTLSATILLSVSVSAHEHRASHQSTGAEAHAGHEHSAKLVTDEQNQASYVCPMHPQIVSDEAESCSICGMHLVKQTGAEESKHHDHSSTSNHHHANH